MCPCSRLYFSMDEFDGENLIVYGGSQGGALAIVTAALDPRIKVWFPSTRLSVI